MLDKNPAKRPKLKELLGNKWINEGYEAALHLGVEGSELVVDMKSADLLNIGITPDIFKQA
jgi:hypothetical protein